MDPEKALAICGFAWMIVSAVLMVRSVRQGQALTDELAARHPDLYASLGRPRPGYFDSVQRSRFAQFLGRREFEQIPDPPLVARLEDHRKAEARTVIAIIAAGAVLAAFMVALRRGG